MLSFALLVVTVFSQHVVVNGFTGSQNKFCNLSVSRTKTSFNYKEVRYIMYMSLCKPLRDLPRKYISDLQNGNNVKLIILKKSQLSIDLLASGSGDFTYDGDKAKWVSDSPCKEFSLSNSLNYSVVLSFKCSQEENEPIFEGFRQESCSFIFKWQAPFACLMLQQTRSNCSLQFGKTMFDMTSLTHPSHYTLHQGDFKVYINFCGPVNLKDCQSSGSVISGCIIHKNKTYIMDNICKKEFVKEKSRIEVEYCMIQGVKGILDFQCNRDVFSIKPEIRVSKKSRKLSIIVTTSVVCLSDDRCDINYGDERYSLSGGSNGMINDTNGMFLLSSCGPLIPDSFWLGGEASASLISETVMSLGSKRSLERVDEGNLRLTLTEGSFCPGTKERAKTVMELICSEVDTGPEFVEKSEKCVFSFRWKGPSYCPVLEATGRGCDVRDPKYGSNYRLDGDGANSENEFEVCHKDIVFRLNLCGKLKKSCHSDTDTSICLLANNKEVVLGTRSSQTYSFKQGSLVFELWGSECAPNVTFHVIVKVVCEFGTSDRFVPVSNDSNCIFNFVWYTGKTCPKGEELRCTVKNQNGSVVDLTPLRLLASNYRVPKDSDSYFLLNVCGPLWYGSHETCPPSSAACLVNKGDNFRSIGEIYKGLTVTDNNEIILVYKNVNFLPPSETVITFICDERNKGPQYIGTEDEKHSFQWKTKLACFNKSDSERRDELKQVVLIPRQDAVEKKQEMKLISNDSISRGVTDTEAKKINSSSKSEKEEEEVSCFTSDSQSSIDLSVLEPVYVSYNNCVRLYVDVCRKVSCLSSNSSEIFRLGSRINRPIVNDRGFVTVNYYDDVLCGDHSNRSLSFIFVCDKSQGKGIPRLANQSSCSGTFLWNTRVVCPNDVLVLDKSNHIINKSSNEDLALDRFLINPIQIERESESFYVNLLSDVLDGEVPCSGNICEKKNDTWISLGILKNVISYNYNYNRIVMEFEGGDLCNGTRRYSSTVYLNCSENEIAHQKSADWLVSRRYCELILEVVTPCFELRPVNAAHGTLIICIGVFGVLLVVCSVIFGSYYMRKKRKRRLSHSEMKLICRERQKHWDKEL